MEFLDWLLLILAGIVVLIGLAMLAGYVMLRQADQDKDYWS